MDRTSFLSDNEFLALETPCSWNYTPRPITTQNSKPWRKPKSPRPSKKDSLGPGKYTDGVEHGYKLMMKSSVSHSFSKSNTPSPLHCKIEETKYFPGVGSYQNLDKAYACLNSYKRVRTAVILPYKNKGFADDDIKRSKETPGPGAYNIGPPKKLYS